MSGTRAGGLKAAKTNLKRYGKDFYKENGALGGSTPKKAPAGFAYLKATDPDKFREASAKGGFISRRKAST